MLTHPSLSESRFRAESRTGRRSENRGVGRIEEKIALPVHTPCHSPRRRDDVGACQPSVAGLGCREPGRGHHKPARYVPEKITVKVGTTVEFRNTGQVVHDVTTDASIAQDKADVSLPPGAEPFDSGFLAPGQSWSYTFTVPGRYLYACIPHEKDRMVGEVLVTK